MSVQFACGWSESYTSQRSPSITAQAGFPGLLTQVHSDFKVHVQLESKTLNRALLVGLNRFECPMCYRVNVELCPDTTPIGRSLNVVDCCPRRRWASKKQWPKGFFQRLKGTASNVVPGFTLAAQNAMLDFRRHPKLFGRPSLVRGVVCTETAL